MASTSRTTTAISARIRLLPQLVTVDRMFERGVSPDQIYQELKSIYEITADDGDRLQVLWRIAKACLLRAQTVITSDSSSYQFRARQGILERGIEWANKALKINNNHFSSMKYKCMLTGLVIVGHKIPMNTKMEYTLSLYTTLERAAKFRPNDREILHLQGRLIYSIARLTRIERMAAMAFCPSMSKLIKSANIESALEKFMQAELQLKGTSIDNLFFMARCYETMKQTGPARGCYAKVVQLRPTNSYERNYVEESRRKIS